MQPFKLLRGRTILLDVPKKKESGLQLSAKDEDAIMQEAMKMWSKLNVFAVGDKVEERCKSIIEFFILFYMFYNMTVAC